MIDTVFRGLFDSALTSVIRITDFILCMGVSLILGFVMALAYMYRTRYTKSFVITLDVYKRQLPVRLKDLMTLMP